MRKRLYIVGIVTFALVALTASFLLYLDKKHRPLADTVTLTFLGYTNDLSGARIGRFKVTNPSPIGIDLASRHEIQVETNNSWTFKGLQSVPLTVVLPKQSTVLEFAAPTLEQRWRVWVSYQDHTDFAEDCLLQLKRLGLPVSFKIRWYSSSSDPIDP